MPTNTCTTCQYFDPTERKPGSGNDNTGMCRFPAPVIQTAPGTRPWPYCKLTDWCSHWTGKS